MIFRPPIGSSPSIAFVLALALALASCSPAGTEAERSASTASQSAQAAPSAGSGTPQSSPPAAGQAVDIGGRTLYIECRGTGSPTVILEAGLAGDHRTWERVQPALADSTRVCAYDRANIPPSDSAPKPRTAQDAVDDLHRLLDRTGIDPPVVIVGFSMGGLIAQLYSSTYPDEVAGLVLVESSHPDEWDQFAAELTPEQIEEDRAASLDNPEGFDPYASFEQAQAAGPLPEVPLVVVTAGISEGWPPGWDPTVFDALRAEQQADLADLVSDGRQIIAEESAHHVPGQQPEVIIEAVGSVLADAN